MLDEAQARRLARAICADVLLYNDAAKTAPLEQRAALFAEPVQEGRALFVARAAPEHHAIFDQTVDELIARPHGMELRSLLAKPAIVGAPMPRIGAPIAESSSAMPVVIGVALLLLLIASALAFFLIF